MFTLTQRDILFVLVGGIIGIGSMFVLLQYTTLGSEQARYRYAEEYAAESGHAMHSDGDGQAMQTMMHDMNAALVGKAGDALDKEFLLQMIVHHEGAVEMAKVLLAGTQRPELVKMGNDIVALQTQEINQMRTWLGEWFGMSE